MKWLVAHTRALESALGYATSHFRDYLFKLILFLGDLAPLTHITCTLVSPVGGPHSLGEIRGAAAVGKASAAARNFLRVPSAPREPMAMALTQAPRTGALVPMGVGVARLFLKKF